jgi:hypothetical protein
LTLTVDDFKCKETEAALSNRKDAEVAINYMRIEKGCGVIGKTPRIEIDGIEYYSCLCHPNFNDMSVSESMWLFRQYEKGHLGFEGSLLDQPNKYVELIKFMDRLTIEHTERINKEQG